MHPWHLSYEPPAICTILCSFKPLDAYQLRPSHSPAQRCPYVYLFIIIPFLGLLSLLRQVLVAPFAFT